MSNGVAVHHSSRSLPAHANGAAGISTMLPRGGLHGSSNSSSGFSISVPGVSAVGNEGVGNMRVENGGGGSLRNVIVCSTTSGLGGGVPRMGGDGMKNGYRVGVPGGGGAGSGWGVGQQGGADTMMGVNGHHHGVGLGAGPQCLGGAKKRGAGVMGEGEEGAGDGWLGAPGQQQQFHPPFISPHQQNALQQQQQQQQHARGTTAARTHSYVGHGEDTFEVRGKSK